MTKVDFFPAVTGRSGSSSDLFFSLSFSFFFSPPPPPPPLSLLLSLSLSLALSRSLVFSSLSLPALSSGQIAKTIQTVGKEEEKIRQVQIDYGRRAAALQPELSKFRLLFNPVLIASSSIFALEPAMKKKKTFRNLKLRVRRGSVSNLNVNLAKDTGKVEAQNDDHTRRRSMALGRTASQLYCPFEINQLTQLLNAGRKNEVGLTQ